MERSVYVVLGMHRSGTSALSGLLAATGVRAPRTLLPADEYNARGYFESSRIAGLNTQRLNALGSAWDDVFAFPLPSLPQAQEARWRGHAKALLADEFGAEGPLLLKDPRITLLLPAWRAVFEALNLKPRCIIAVRRPLAVAASLARRDLFAPQKSVLLWTSYMLAAAAFTRDIPTVCVDYDALIADGRAQLRRIAATHGLPEAAEGDIARAEGFLSAELQHHSAEGDLAALGWVGALAADVHAWFAAAAQDRPRDHAELRAVAEKLDARRRDIGPLVTPISHQLDLARTRLAVMRRELEARRPTGGAS